MDWNRYLPPNPDFWQGRQDSLPGERFFQQVQLVDLSRENSLSSVKARPCYAFLGFCCDEGVRRNLGRVGASAGPRFIRQALAKLAMPERHAFALVDVGDIVCADGDLEASQQALATMVADLLRQGCKPIVLGGGHEMAWGHYQGIAQAYPRQDLGIINFDAHFDLRPLTAEGKGHSGSPFLQIAQARAAQQLPFNYYCIGIQTFANTPSLVQTATNLQTSWITAAEIHTQAMTECCVHLDKFIARHATIYLTLCLDVIAAAFAPGVSAPQPLGLLPWQVIMLLRRVVRSGRVLSVDIAELAPSLDRDLVTAQLAASLVAEYLTTC